MHKFERVGPNEKVSWRRNEETDGGIQTKDAQEFKTFLGNLLLLTCDAWTLIWLNIWLIANLSQVYCLLKFH